ncbi:hypothetical protein PILCRDRAFT_686259 [Piloderma croceum F 1598]|uniref:Uncharacterized protein n=1 Tax=Piloderma croceum (strain F 1598) TaxID=765440 RepID=A0A0C3BD11_PILCF|nr:hypothetical protein PILCRDRAFT_686259 [Piloderma croceum F 1598]
MDWDPPSTPDYPDTSKASSSTAKSACELVDISNRRLSDGSYDHISGPEKKIPNDLMDLRRPQSER